MKDISTKLPIRKLENDSYMIGTQIFESLNSEIFLSRNGHKIMTINEFLENYENEELFMIKLYCFENKCVVDNLNPSDFK